MSWNESIVLEEKMSATLLPDTIPTTRPRQKTVWISDGSTEPIKQYYTIGKQLGKAGTFGTVYECTRISDNEQFAVKIISKENLYDAYKSSYTRDVLLSVLRSEIEVMGTLKHKYIINLECVFEDKHHLWIVMERCDGGELLKKVQKEGRLNELEVSRIVKMLLEALNYMHSVHSVVHLDLKLENILFANNGNDNDIIKIIDFGMSQVLPRLERLNLLCGTPYYTAPEVIRGNYGHSADMWSVGVMAFALLFGFHAFQDHSSGPDSGGQEKEQKQERKQRNDDRIERIYGLIERGFDARILHGKGAWFPADIGVSGDAYDFISKLLEFDESKRMTAKEALLHRWIVKFNMQSVNSNNSTRFVTNSNGSEQSRNIAENSKNSKIEKHIAKKGEKKRFGKIKDTKFAKLIGTKFGKKFAKKRKKLITTQTVCNKNNANNAKSNQNEEKEEESKTRDSSLDEENCESGKETEDDIVTKELICMFANFGQSKGLKYAMCLLFKQTYITARPKHYEMMKKLFKTFDINKDNKISSNEFATIMFSLRNVRFDKKQILVIFNEMDIQKCGHIVFDEFLNVAIHDYLVGNDARMDKLFYELAIMDIDRMDTIDINDLYSDLQECCSSSSHCCNDNYINLVFNELKLSDINNDGQIDYDEFLKALHPKFNDIPEWLWNAKVNLIKGNLSV